MLVMSLLYRRPSGKGNRLIILHAGSENGWLPHAELVLEAKKTSGEYHDEMNSERYKYCFFFWSQNTLIFLYRFE